MFFLLSCGIQYIFVEMDVFSIYDEVIHVGYGQFELLDWMVFYILRLSGINQINQINWISRLTCSYRLDGRNNV